MKWLKDVTESEIQIFANSKDQFLATAKFFIFSYELAVRRETEINNFNFNIVIADEAHYLKG